MPIYLSPLDSDSELQWDQDSIPNQPYNCGPSSAEKVANYFKNLTKYGIERTRNLATSRDKTGTTAAEQSTMLMKRGVDNDAQRISPAKVKQYLASGRRPLMLAILMGAIPDDIKGHSFDGSHSVAALANGIVDGQPGIWVNEPNQKRGSKTYKKNRFYPDRYWMKGYELLGKWAIVPSKDKVIPSRRPYKKACTVMTDVLNIRTAPSAQAADIGNLSRGDKFTSNLIETAGGTYLVGGKLRRDWLGYVRNGKQVWVARAYCKEA
jgi:hypothetical protein